MRSLALVMAGTLLLQPPAAAQFGVSAELGLGFMGGTSQDTSNADVGSLRPYRPTQLTLRPGWRFGRFTVDLGLTYATPPIAVEGSYTFVFNDTGRTMLIEAAPEVGYRLFVTGTGVSFNLHAGPVVDLWTILGENRTVAGGQVAASVQVPLASRIQLVVRGSGVVTKSALEKSDLPSQVAVQAMRRGTVALGVRYGP